jgi:hypothetical protein
MKLIINKQKCQNKPNPNKQNKLITKLQNNQNKLQTNKEKQ